MSRLDHVDPARAQGEAKTLYARIERQLGGVPNFMQVLANSPPTLAAFLGLSGNLSRGALDPQLRERLALNAAEANACQYCVSAHTALGAQSGLSEAEIVGARQASSGDARAQAALTFAQAVLTNRGEVTSAELSAVRQAGFSDGEVVEIIAHVALNILTNYLGKVGQIDIDFPRVELLGQACAAS